MKRLIFALAITLLVASLSAQQPAVSIRNGTADPATCKPGSTNIFYRSDTAALKVCSASNIWTALGGGSGTVTSVGNGTIGSLFTATWATATTTPALSFDITNQGTVAQVLHGNAAGHPSFGPVVSADLNVTGTTCSNQFLTVLSSSLAGTCTTATLAGAQFANQGSTTTLLHGAAAGNPAWSAVVSADLNITATTCTNQFLSAISAAAAGTCTTDVLASAQHANQGTTTTLLHGNAAGNPSFGAVLMTADVSGTLPVGNGGTGNTTGTATTNANLTGPITSAGNATSVASQTGTGSTFMMQTAPVPTTVNVSDGNLQLKGGQLQSFVVKVINNGGTIQHNIYDEADTATLGNFAGKITGASSTAANTPTVDSTHGFTSGAGIDSTATWILVLNTAAQVNADTIAMASVDNDTTLTGVICQIRSRSINVNGTTRRYFGIALINATTGAAFNINTTNFTAGTAIGCRVLAFMQ